MESQKFKYIGVYEVYHQSIGYNGSVRPGEEITVQGTSVLELETHADWEKVIEKKPNIKETEKEGVF